MASKRKKPRVLILTGFEPFGGEKFNPSWEIAQRFDGKNVAGLEVRAARLPVVCREAVNWIMSAIRHEPPFAVLSLGQAGGRTAISLERVAVNLVDSHLNDGSGTGHISEGPVVGSGPDAYFSRLPLAEILRALHRQSIPASFSLSAGVFICNAVMYASLHELRRNPRVPCGFIHLPYEARQVIHRPGLPSMPAEVMERAVGLAIVAIAKAI